MKMEKRIAVVLSVLLIGVMLIAASKGSRQQKTAFIDMNRALNEVDEGKMELGKLEQWKNQKTKELEKKEKELMDRKEKLKQEESTLSADVYKKKVEKYLQDVEEYQRQKMSVAQELQNRLAQSTIYVKKRMDLVIAEIAEKEGFDVVIDVTEGGVVYYPPYLDITNEVIRMYNKRYPLKKK